jgi:hypothetical protein
VNLDGKTRRGLVRPLGRALFMQPGYDPYLEFAGTLWILQWQLCRKEQAASTWHYAFTRWNKAIFTREQLLEWLHRVAQDSGNAKASRASLKRDVDVFLRTYVQSSSDKIRAPEDSFECPLTELGLIREIEPSTFELHRRTRASLPVAVLVYALWDYWELSFAEQNTLSFERLMYGAGSPGGAFQLSDGAMADMLSRLPADCGLLYDESAGMRRLIRSAASAPSTASLIRDCYGETA